MTLAPSRAPRGRNGGRRRKADTELLQRINKLEGIVKDLGGQSGEGNETTTQDPVLEDPRTKSPAGKSPDKTPKEGLERYIAGSLFEDLSHEIHGLREVFDQSSEDDEGTDGPSPSGSDWSSFVLGISDGTTIDHPTSPKINVLYKYFVSNVHPMIRILHQPSVYRYLIEQSAQLDCSPGPRGWEALKFAMFYTTVTSMTHEECTHELHEEKDALVSRFRRGTESALARADFINTEELSTLQALVLYLVGKISYVIMPGWQC